MASAPTPPPGFELETAPRNPPGSTPPPPPGFQIETQSAQPPGLMARAIGGLVEQGEQAKGFTKGLIESADKLSNVVGLGIPHALENRAKDKHTGETMRHRMDKQEQPNNPAQKTGKMAESVAEALVPIPGLSELKAPAAAGKLAKLGMNVARGAIDTAAHAATKADSPKDVAIAGATGGVAGTALSAIPAAAKAINRLGREQYAIALAPSGVAARQVARDVLLHGGPDDLVSKGVVALTAKGLNKKLGIEANRAGADVESAYNALGPQAQQNLRPIFARTWQWVKDQSRLPVSQRPGNPQLEAQGRKFLTNVMDTIGTISDAHPSDVRRFRQIIDDELFAKKLKINPTTAADRVKQSFANVVRDEIHKARPDLARVDQAFHFWKTASKLMQRSVDSKFGKQEYLTHLGGVLARPSLGFAAGAAFGMNEHSSGDQILQDSLIGGGIMMATQSTLWRTVSPVMKDRIAKVLVSHGNKYASDLAARSIGLATVRKTHPSTAYAEGQPPPGPLVPIGPIRPPLRRESPPQTEQAPNAPPTP